MCWRESSGKGWREHVIYSGVLKIRGRYQNLMVSTHEHGVLCQRLSHTEMSSLAKRLVEQEPWFKSLRVAIPLQLLPRFSYCCRVPRQPGSTPDVILKAYLTSVRASKRISKDVKTAAEEAAQSQSQGRRSGWTCSMCDATVRRGCSVALYPLLRST